MHQGLRIYPTDAIHYDCSINHKDIQLADHNKGYIQSLGHDVFYYNHGDLSLITANHNEIHEQPLLYAHFQKRSMGNEVTDEDCYCIANNKFINIPKPTAADEVIRLTPRPIIDFTPQKRFLQRVKRRLFPKRFVQYYHWSPALQRLKDETWTEKYNR